MPRRCWGRQGPSPPRCPQVRVSLARKVSQGLEWRAASARGLRGTGETRGDRAIPGDRAAGRASPFVLHSWAPAGPLKEHPLGFWEPTFSSTYGSTSPGSQKSALGNRGENLGPSSAVPGTVSQWLGPTMAQRRVSRGQGWASGQGRAAVMAAHFVWECSRWGHGWHW